MILHGKEKGVEHILKSSVAFISQATYVQRRFSSVSMPPIDHYTLQFDHQNMRTLRGRVYEKMIDFDYAQLGEGIVAASNDIHFGIRKVQISVPTVGHLYVVCLNGRTKEIAQLIEIDRTDVDEIIDRCK